MFVTNPMISSRGSWNSREPWWLGRDERDGCSIRLLLTKVVCKSPSRVFGYISVALIETFVASRNAGMVNVRVEEIMICYRKLIVLYLYLSWQMFHQTVLNVASNYYEQSGAFLNSLNPGHRYRPNCNV